MHVKNASKDLQNNHKLAAGGGSSTAERSAAGCSSETIRADTRVKNKSFQEQDPLARTLWNATSTIPSKCDSAHTSPAASDRTCARQIVPCVVPTYIKPSGLAEIDDTPPGKLPRHVSTQEVLSCTAAAK